MHQGVVSIGFSLFFVLIVSCEALGAPGAPAKPQSHPLAEINVEGTATRTISAPRARTPKSVTLTNRSTTTGASVRLWTSESPDLSSFSRMLDYIHSSADGTTSRALALSAWRIIHNKRYWWIGPTDDDEPHDPVKLLNVYGYGLCDDNARALATLWEALGLQVSAWDLRFHTIAEYGDGITTHMLDGDLGFYSPDPETGEPMSVEQIQADPRYLRSIDPVKVKESKKFMIGLRKSLHDRASEGFIFKRVGVCGHEIVYHLRPGESMKRYLLSDMGFYSLLDTHKPPRYANAVFDWRPNLDSIDWNDTASPAAETPETTVAHTVVRSTYPFVLVSGSVEVEYSEPQTTVPAVLFSRGKGLKWYVGVPARQSARTGNTTFRLSVPAQLKGSYDLRIALPYSHDSHPTRFWQHIITQCSPSMFPALASRGRPTQIYVESDTTAPLEIRYE